MGVSISRSIVIGALAAFAFLKVPALAENTSEQNIPQQEAAKPVEAKETLVAQNVAVELAKPQKPKLFSHASYPAAWTASQETNRPILLYVSMSGCPHCDKMMAESYHSPDMEKMLTESFETIYVTRKKHPKLVEKLKVKWYPTTVLVGPNNKVMDVIEGYVDTKTFRRRLQTGLASSTKSVQTR